MPRAYLDHNASTPLHPAARAAMSDALDLVGNPSSIHAEGRAARTLIETARRDVATLTGSTPEDVFFTSGGTEALNMILTPELGSAEGPIDVLFVGAGEHSAVSAGHRFAADKVVLVVTDANGVFDLAALAAALDRHRGHRVMLALQAANNETGVIQPVAEAAALVHRHGGFVVCDAVQAAGKIDCRIGALGADAIAISGHKFGGPKGVGALIFAPSSTHLRQGVVRGGGQERGLRSGTENLSGIAGIGAAARTAGASWQGTAARLKPWRTALEQIVSRHVPDAVVFGEGVSRLANTAMFAAPGYAAQVMLMNLDLGGVAVSAGSACASGKIKPSPVLRAMGVSPDLAATAIRVSLGWTTTDGDIAAFEDAFGKAVRLMRSKAAGIAA
ncbi:cysteine desulfurase family protein [Beijerinckia sp. L45]|uniref:cysteine desulfurase family protein n=1 Tax=Beijerinckia sp. L45 TaxID=1641855 RepID=UPI001FEFDD4B|nr:cysteine desulfurase family protein [Beijerinckia sp. L45]